MIEIYEFALGGERYRYCTGDSVITLGGYTYAPAPIERNEISKDFEAESASLTLPISLEPAPRFRILNPSVIVSVSISKSDGARLFVGRVGSCSFDLKGGKATLKLVSLQGMMKTKIPSRTYSRACSFELFGLGCDLSKETYKTIVLPNQFSADSTKTKITSPLFGAKPAGFFSAGYVELAWELSYILAHEGNQITLLFPLQLLSNQSSLYVYPGCDKTRAACGSKFDNERNFGGFPFIPEVNPTTQGF